MKYTKEESANIRFLLISYHDSSTNHDDPSTNAKQFLCARSCLIIYLGEKFKIKRYMSKLV